MKLQHRHRREGGVTVGSTRYELDSDGCVEVSEEHAEKMLQGANWAAPGVFTPPEKLTPKPEGAGGRVPRTKEQLVGVAAGAGVPVPEPPAPDLPPPPPPRVVTEEDLSDSHGGPEIGSPVEEEETVTINAQMSKAELLDVAKQLGVEVPKWATKTKIVELIAAAQGD